MNRVGRTTEVLMRMDDSVWERHANPWSVWTRVAIMPLLAVAVWSRVWIDWWFCVPTVMALVWIWANPRVFPKPKSLASWASRGVLGERIWLAGEPGTIAVHHRRVIRVLMLVSGLGGVMFVGGLIWLNLAATLLGLAVAMLGKLWFVDRMVWIQRENEWAESAGEDFTADRGSFRVLRRLPVDGCRRWLRSGSREEEGKFEFGRGSRL